MEIVRKRETYVGNILEIINVHNCTTKNLMKLSWKTMDVKIATSMRMDCTCDIDGTLKVKFVNSPLNYWANFTIFAECTHFRGWQTAIVIWIRRNESKKKSTECEVHIRGQYIRCCLEFINTESILWICELTRVVFSNLLCEIFFTWVVVAYRIFRTKTMGL